VALDMSWITNNMKKTISVRLFCEQLAKDNVELIDVVDYYDYIEEEVWGLPSQTVDEIVNRIFDFDMATLICLDNNYEPPAKKWVKLVLCNSWPDIVADYSYVPTYSECKPKTDANPDSVEDAMCFFSSEEPLWEYVCNEIDRLENEIKQLKSKRP